MAWKELAVRSRCERYYSEGASLHKLYNLVSRLKKHAGLESRVPISTSE